MPQMQWNDAEISTGFRPIKDGSHYDRYFPKPEKQDKVVMQNGDVEDTVRLMERVVWTYKEDTKQIASLLNRTSTEATCRAIWQFMYDFVQYKLDQAGLEQLRRPARSWSERATGVDCDCMSIFVSSILLNLNIPHSFRITKYSKDNWQHVYVIVPSSPTKYYTIDAVLGRNNYEKPFSQNKDFPMNLDGINIAVLSGLDEEQNYLPIQSNPQANMEQAIMGTQFLGVLEQYNEDTLLGMSDAALSEATYQYLLKTRVVAKANPLLLVAAGDNNPNAFLAMLDYAIMHWNTPNRAKALDVLIANENAMNKLNGIDEEILGGIEDELLFGDDDLYGFEDIQGLGRAKAKKQQAPKPKKFFKKVGATVKKVGTKIGQTAKKLGKAVVRFNPLTIASRNGFLLALKLNVAKMSEKLKWAYASPQQAAAKRISPEYVAKAKRALVKVEKLFTKIGGKSNNLRNAILSSKKGKLNGLGFVDIGSGIIEGLGIAPAAGVAAAIPLITAVVTIMKSTGLIAPNEEVAMEPSEDESPEFESQGYESGNVFDNGGNDNPTEYTPTEEVVYEEEPLEGLGNVVVTIKDFVSNNPMVALAGAGLLAFGLYEAFGNDDASKSKAKNQLAGLTTARKRNNNRPAQRKKNQVTKFTLK